MTDAQFNAIMAKLNEISNVAQGVGQLMGTMTSMMQVLFMVGLFLLAAEIIEGGR